jgi:polysaccharide biosynthesis transport protein
MAFDRQVPTHMSQGEYIQPAATPARAAESSPALEIDLLDIAARIWRRRFTVVATVILGMLATGAAALFLEPSYTSESRIMIETRQTEIVQSEAVLSDLTATQQVVETEIEVIRSGEINERVARRLDLPAIMARRAEEASQESLPQRLSALVANEALSEWLLTVFSPERLAALIPEAWADTLLPADEPAPPPTLEEAVKLLASKLEARQIGSTAVIEISATDTDPNLALELVRTTVDEYLEAQVEWKSAATLSANSWLRGRIDELQSELTEKQRSREYMRSVVGVVDDEGRSLLAEQQMLINARLHDARAQRIRLETRLAEFEETLRRGGINALASLLDQSLLPHARAGDRSLLAQLRITEEGLKQEIAEISSIFGPQHPDLVDAEKRLAMLRAEVEDETMRGLSEASSSLAAVRQEEEELQRELDKLREEAKELGHQRTKLSGLQSEIDTMQSLLESYLTRYRETREQEAIIRPDARVITAAGVPEAPTFQATSCCCWPASWCRAGWAWCSPSSAT